jgi:hypothetical protein
VLAHPRRLARHGTCAWYRGKVKAVADCRLGPIRATTFRTRPNRQAVPCSPGATDFVETMLKEPNDPPIRKRPVEAALTHDSIQIGETGSVHDRNCGHDLVGLACDASVRLIQAKIPRQEFCDSRDRMIRDTRQDF